MNDPLTRASLLHALQSLSPGKRRAAWEVFEPLYRPLIFAWCLQKSLHRDVAEDLTQDILLKLSLKFPEHCYDAERGRFRSWLSVFVKHALLDYFRRRQRQIEARGIGGTDHLGVVAQIPDPESADQLSQEIANHPRTKLLRAVALVEARTSPTQWRAFWAFTYEGRAAAVIAAELGLSTANVYKIAQRIKKEIAEERNHV